ncbi:MAG TPA: transcription termination factor NusA [Bacilli bacterium]|nr:transcription termination factor NusA [Bacilli bacterium]
MKKLTKAQIRKKQERLDAIKGLFTEVAEKHNLVEDVVRDKFLLAVRNVYARSQSKIGSEDLNVDVIINEELYDIEARYFKKVVATEDDINDAALEITLEDAKLRDETVNVGDDVIYETMLLGSFPTKLANNVTSNFRQSLVELEKEQLYNLFKDKIGELIKGTIEKTERATYVNLLGATNVFFDERGRHAIPGEVFRNGEEINFYVKDVVAGKRGANIIISRSEPDFVRRLMEREIHEIYDGTIVIHDVVRERGERVKVSVESLDENVDPVGACIGPNASRIQKITAELGPDGRKEKIDIIPYDKNIELFIIEAFRPAVPIGITANHEEKTATVIFEDEEKGKAFGHKGANIRLASKLTGYELNILEHHEAVEQELEFRTKDHIAYEARLLEQEKTRELIRQEILSSQKVSEEISDEALLEAYYGEEETEKVERVVTPEISEEVAEEIETVIEEATAPVEVKVKTTISLAELEAELEEEKPETTRRRAPRRKREEVKEEVVIQGPQMQIYTDEELAELEASIEEEEEYYDDDIDYDDFDEYYDED